MNAGAYGGELKDVLEEVTVLNQEGEILKIPFEKLEMGYRTSIVKKKNYIVLEAVLKLRYGDEDKIRQTMRELTEKEPASNH